MRLAAAPRRLITTGQQTIHLGPSLGRGGEGEVFGIPDGRVCKVFHGITLEETRAKLELMVQRSVEVPGVCWPQELVLDGCGQFAGYLMARAGGSNLVSVLRKHVLTRAPYSWSRRDLLRAAIAALSRIQALHGHQVLLGDINLRNIRVDADGEVYFLDLDSCQIGGYCSPVGQVPFLAPELIGANLRTTARTFESELFAVATLVFMILAPGKSPYSHCGGEDPAENVRRGHFPYCRGEVKGAAVPAGPWRFIWSHFPRYLKDAFHKVFSDGQRLEISEWVFLLSRYESDIGKGYLSDLLFPDGFKRLSKAQVVANGGEMVTCSECGELFGRWREQQTLCPTCVGARPAVVVHAVSCAECGCAFTIRGRNPHPPSTPLCGDCRRELAEVVMERTCIVCFKEFELTQRDVNYFDRKRWNYPDRCPPCRARRTSTTPRW